MKSQDDISLLPEMTNCSELIISIFTHIFATSCYMLQSNIGLYDKVGHSGVQLHVSKWFPTLFNGLHAEADG